jgi:hypothetical protein
MSLGHAGDVGAHLDDGAGHGAHVPSHVEHEEPHAREGAGRDQADHAKRGELAEKTESARFLIAL